MSHNPLKIKPQTGGSRTNTLSSSPTQGKLVPAMLTQELIEEITKSIKTSLDLGLTEIKQQIKGVDGKMESMDTKLTQNTKKMEDLMEIIEEQEVKIEKQEGKIKDLEYKLKKEQNIRMKMERAAYTIRLQNVPEKKKETK